MLAKPTFGIQSGHVKRVWSAQDSNELFLLTNMIHISSQKQHHCIANQYTALTLYQSLILPQISCCDLVYETTNQSNRDKLQKNYRIAPCIAY